MTRIYDLSRDLIEEILSRVPLTSHVAVRSTCKQWNGLYKDQSFTKKHRGRAAKDPMMIMVRDYRVCLVSVDLQRDHNHNNGLVELSTKPIGKLNQCMASEVYHCDGLLLCLPKLSIVKPELVVLNPYLGQVRSIKPRKNYSAFDRYCIGYDKDKNHKILRLLDHYGTSFQPIGYEIYDVKSDLWRVLDVTPTWCIPFYRRGVSLKGNTYFVAQERVEVRALEMGESLLCFDFTRERFLPRLDLEFNSRDVDSVILSTVREEQLAVLLHRLYAFEMEIRITTKINANEMSWSHFIKVDKKPFSGRVFTFFHYASFFVDEENKTALICDYNKEKTSNNRAYVIGDDNYFKDVALKESTCLPLACSYVPSSVEIQKGPVPAGVKRKERDY